MPLTLPACQVPKERWQQHYSLSAAKRELQPLHAQILEFTSWITDAQRFDRPTGGVAKATATNILDSLYLFLGYLENHMGISTPSLLNLLNPEEFISFISFQVAKGRSVGSITGIIGHAKKTLGWLGRVNHHLQPRINEIFPWLDSVRRQLSMSLPHTRRDIGQLEAGGKWIEAGDLVVKVDVFVRKVLGWIDDLAEGCPLGEGLARALHNATLASCMFSHMPPVRLLCWRSLMVPGTPGCSKEDCSIQGCRGNRLYYKSRALCLLLSHYKVDKR